MSSQTALALHIFHKRECDPKKCTALKLSRLGLTNIVYRIGGLPTNSLLLYPYCNSTLAPNDHEIIAFNGLSAIDCSWNRIEVGTYAKRFNTRQLPFLLAANPTNYAIPYKLSTLEALAAALFITDFKDTAVKLLETMKWGPTFLTLNEEPLSLYASAKNSEEVKKIEADYRKIYSRE